MSRNRNNRNPKQYSYNRQSKGYQQNLYKQKLNQEGIKAPKTVDQKKLRIAAIVAGVIWLILTVVLIIYLRWKGLLIGLLVGLAAVGCAYLYLRHKQLELFSYYKKIGMTEEMYIKELKKRNTDVKQIEGVRRMWKKAK